MWVWLGTCIFEGEMLAVAADLSDTLGTRSNSVKNKLCLDICAYENIFSTMPSPGYMFVFSTLKMHYGSENSTLKVLKIVLNFPLNPVILMVFMG